MRSLVRLRVLTLLFTLAAPVFGQSVILRLTSDLSSKMPSGTLFEAKDDNGRVYHGHIVTHPARRMLRNGSMLLVFDDEVKPVNKDREGMYHGSNKMRLLKLGGGLSVAKIADDCVDGTIGATKARYVGAAAATSVLLFMKGQEAKLHAGDTVEVAPDRQMQVGQ
jgi:hypothetical protein